MSSRIFPQMERIGTCSRCRRDFRNQVHTRNTCEAVLLRAIHDVANAPAGGNVYNEGIARCGDIINAFMADDRWDINIQAHETGDTALHLACHYRIQPIIASILQFQGAFQHGGLQWNLQNVVILMKSETRGNFH